MLTPDARYFASQWNIGFNIHLFSFVILKPFIKHLGMFSLKLQRVVTKYPMLLFLNTCNRSMSKHM